MSIIAARPVPHSLTELRLRALLAPLFARKSLQGRLHGDLRDLPDYLLLDIAVDPRDVPVRAEEAGAQAEVFCSELTARLARTAAKS